MSKQNSWLIGACFLIAGIAFLIYLSHDRIAFLTFQARPGSAQPRQSSAQSSSEGMTPFPNQGKIVAAREAEIKKEQGLVSSWILTPITFYGKVVDETGKPVEDAKAVLSAADHPFASGSRYDRMTDVNGVFSITGIHGAGLQVTVSKEGYYSLPQSRGSFGYAARTRIEQPPQSDSNAPALFVLKKIRATEPLIVLHKFIDSSPAGIPITLDLRTGQGYGSASKDVTVQIWNHSYDPGFVRRWDVRWDWRSVVTVPGGGIQPRTGGEFNFTAPETGYFSSDEIVMAKLSSQWRDSVAKEYFVKLASGEYALLRIEIVAAGQNFFKIDSYLNPTVGHRNLESDTRERDALAH